MLFGGGDHLVVADRASGLDDRGHARLRSPVHAVTERKERVGCEARPLRPIACLTYGDVDGIDPVHLSRPDGDRGQVRGKDDCVRLHPRGHLPREDQVLPLIRRRLHRGHDLHVRPGLHDGVHVLDQSAPLDRPNLEPTARGDGSPNQPQVRLSGQDPYGFGAEGGSHHDLGEYPRHDMGCRGVHLAVERDDASVGRNRVGVERLAVRLGQSPGQGHPRRVVVLHDDGHGSVEETGGGVGRFGVQPVVERHLLPLEHVRSAERPC